MGFAQAFLTLSNAILATRIAVNERFTRRIRDGELALNMGLMNLGAAFLGCVPLCHGSEASWPNIYMEPELGEQ